MQQLLLGDLELLDSQGVNLLPIQKNVHAVLEDINTGWSSYIQVILFPIDVTNITSIYLNRNIENLNTSVIMALRDTLITAHLNNVHSIRFTTNKEQMRLNVCHYLFDNTINDVDNYRTAGYSVEWRVIEGLTE